MTGSKGATITGNLTLHSVTKEVEIKATHVGGGKDPRGGFRQGFSGDINILLADYGMPPRLDPRVTVILQLVVEGIRQ